LKAVLMELHPLGSLFASDPGHFLFLNKTKMTRYRSGLIT